MGLQLQKRTTLHILSQEFYGFEKKKNVFLQNGGKRLLLAFQNYLFRFAGENLLGTRISNNLITPSPLKKGSTPIYYQKYKFNL